MDPHVPRHARMNEQRGRKRCLRCTCRGGDRRALYEGVGCHAESRQFSPLRADRNTHAAQGQASGRAKGHRWQNLADHALARGPKRPTGRLECGKRRGLKRCGTPARCWKDFFAVHILFLVAEYWRRPPDAKRHWPICHRAFWLPAQASKGPFPFAEV